MPEKQRLSKIGNYVTRGARAAAAIVFVGGVLVLLGWALQNEVLKSGIPGLVPMNPATAMLFMLSAVSLWLATPSTLLKEAAGDRGGHRMLFARLGAIAVMVGGLSPLLAYVLGWDPFIDSLLFADRLVGNRMAPNTAIHFVLIALSILATDVRFQLVRYPSQAFACAAIIASILSLLGYLFSARSLYGVGSYIPMAINTAFLFLVLSVGALCTRPLEGLPALLAGNHMGSVMARRLLPVALGITCLIGFLRLLGERTGLYDAEFGVTLMVILNVILISAAILSTAVILNAIDGERRQVTADLNESVERYRFLTDAMPGMMWTASPQGELDYFNHRWYEYTGLNHQQTSGSGWQSAFHPDDRGLCARRWQQACESGADFDMDIRIRNAAEDDYRWHLVRAVARHHRDGQIVQWVGTCTDIDDQKRAAQRIEQLNSQLEDRINQRVAELAEANRELRHKNQENEMFVYSVSHDLRSPLVNLQGFSQELALVASQLVDVVADPAVPEPARNKVNGLLKGGLCESIRFIQTAVTRLSAIIDALLHLSRVGRVEYHFQQVDMNALMVRIVESMGSTVFERGAEVQVLPLLPCWGDETAIEQLFANLIGNAVKYLAPDRPGKIEIGERAIAGPGHVYYVRDNGLGIPEAYQSKVFDAFKRFHPQAAPGDGMGLAIVRRIVERHGAEIRLESTEGMGTTFFVTLWDREIDQLNASGKANTEQGAYHAIAVDSHLASRR